MSVVVDVAQDSALRMVAESYKTRIEESGIIPNGTTVNIVEEVSRDELATNLIFKTRPVNNDLSARITKMLL